MVIGDLLILALTCQAAMEDKLLKKAKQMTTKKKKKRKKKLLFNYGQ